MLGNVAKACSATEVVVLERQMASAQMHSALPLVAQALTLSTLVYTPVHRTLQCLSALWMLGSATLMLGSATLQAAENTTGSATTSSLAPPCMELLLVLVPRCALGAGAGARAGCAGAWLC